MFGLFVTLYAGLEHAFEADHLLAVNNLVTNRKHTGHALKDGFFWGVGHTTTIFVIGMMMIVFKMHISEQVFSYLEACVGLMLVGLGLVRLLKLAGRRQLVYSGLPQAHTHYNHKMAFGVGFVHGLAGSGALAVLVISQMKTPAEGLMYILIFGVGSIVGMLLASGMFSLPYSRALLQSERLQNALTAISSVLCLVYGIKVIIENLS